MKKYVLPILAVSVAAIAIAVSVIQPQSKSQQQSAAKTETTVDANGDYFISTANLSSDTVSFIRPDENSKVELLARIGDDGAPKLALATCQSCNGAPGAYYTQEGDVLRCNNCGLTFPLSVVDEPGGGCHPMILSDNAYTVEEDGILLKKIVVTSTESLFEKVADH